MAEPTTRARSQGRPGFAGRPRRENGAYRLASAPPGPPAAGALARAWARSERSERRRPYQFPGVRRGPGDAAG